MASKTPLPPFDVPVRSKLSAGEKAAATDAAARSITAAEADKRDRKTERLRAARLATEAQDREQPTKDEKPAKPRVAPKTKKRA